jgi:hypothetical protein
MQCQLGFWVTVAALDILVAHINAKEGLKIPK